MVGKALPSSLAEAVRIKSMGHISLQLLRDEGFPGGTSGKKPACQCRRLKRHGFGPWVGKISWRWAQPPTHFLPGESHRQRSLVGYGPQGRTELDTTEVT